MVPNLENSDDKLLRYDILKLEDNAISENRTNIARRLTAFGKYFFSNMTVGKWKIILKNCG